MFSSNAESARTSRLFRYYRKKCGISQKSLALEMGVTQGWMSRLESGREVPNYFDWSRFCEISGVHSDARVTGFIDRAYMYGASDFSVDGEFFVPARYAHDRGTRARLLKSFLELLFRSLGTSGFHEFLSSCGIEADFFVDLDHSVNAQFTLDAVQALLEKGDLKNRSILSLSENVARMGYHRALLGALPDDRTPMGILVSYVQNVVQYEINSRYWVENRTENSIDVVMKEGGHFKSFQIPDGFRAFNCRYKLEVFANVVKIHRPAIKAWAREIECQHQRSDRCIFRLTIL